MGRKRLTKEEFIADARAVHCDKYNYDKVEYKGALKDVIITCPFHGDFPITPSNHKAGRGCPECAKKQRAKAVARARTMTKEDFVEKAMKKHNGKYNYSLVEIKGNRHTKVKIKCNTCGTIFEQRISDHLNGCGCPDCARKRMKEALTMTTEEFIAKAREKHGNKYGYNNAVYKGSHEYITVTCPIHGNFKQMASNHLQGYGCDKCATEKDKELKTDSLGEFIAKAKSIHGNKYNYDKVKYVNNRTPVTITCPIHGDFQQLPGNHKRGYGCDKCNSSHLETKTSVILQENNIVYEPQKKFPWLKNKREMPLDFYLPEFNVAIECQGIQHYESSGNIFTEERLLYTQKNDKLKFTLCQEHGIPLYYIKYNDNVAKRLNEIIIQCLNK